MASSVSFDGALSNPSVVIDQGSGVLKVGLAGEERPKVVMQSVVGRPKHERVMPDSELSAET